MPDWGSAIATVVTLIIGWGLSQLGDERKDRRQAKREQAERENKVSERRAGFQRETLLSLQEAMARLMRATTRIHYEDKMVSRATSTRWGKEPVSEEWSEKQLEAKVDVRTLVVRVEDDELREAVARVLSSSTEVVAAGSEKESVEHLKALQEAHQSATERLGWLLRALY